MSSELDKESERCGGGARVEATFWPWLVYAFKTSEGANPSTTAAATRLFPGGLVWEFLTTTAAATTWDGEMNNERQADRQTRPHTRKVTTGGPSQGSSLSQVIKAPALS